MHRSGSKAMAHSMAHTVGQELCAFGLESRFGVREHKEGRGCSAGSRSRVVNSFRVVHWAAVRGAGRAKEPGAGKKKARGVGKMDAENAEGPFSPQGAPRWGSRRVYNRAVDSHLTTRLAVDVGAELRPRRGVPRRRVERSLTTVPRRRHRARSSAPTSKARRVTTWVFDTLRLPGEWDAPGLKVCPKRGLKPPQLPVEGLSRNSRRGRWDALVTKPAS